MLSLIYEFVDLPDPASPSALSTTHLHRLLVAPWTHHILQPAGMRVSPRLLRQLKPLTSDFAFSSRSPAIYSLGVSYASKNSPPFVSDKEKVKRNGYAGYSGAWACLHRPRPPSFCQRRWWILSDNADQVTTPVRPSSRSGYDQPWTDGLDGVISQPINLEVGTSGHRMK